MAIAPCGDAPILSCNLHLALHGIVILVLGQVAGFAFFRAIQQNTPGTGGWRMSHAACSAGAVLLLALAPVVPHLKLPVPGWSVTVGLVGSTYAFCVGTVIAGWSGQRGMSAGGPRSNRIVYAMYLVGAVGSTLAAIALLFGALAAVAA